MAQRYHTLYMIRLNVNDRVSFVIVTVKNRHWEGAGMTHVSRITGPDQNSDRLG